ncbi:MAG TPA: DUF1800 domain-containing protein [Conexibacter sp.]|nr:DUF1800 domain-containing protein [Conexibacter sp.]
MSAVGVAEAAQAVVADEPVAEAARRRRRARRAARRRHGRRQAHRRARQPSAGSAGWTEAHVRRLFWRAGFGATPVEARRWAKRGKTATLDFVVNGPPGGAQLRGLEPRVDGRTLDPLNEWGDNVLWWLDRMVRTTYPLQEKMTLFWHDHFATSDQDTPMMLAQNRMLRRRALGSFRDLLGDVTRDPAMQLFLSLAGSTKDAPNENFARELMELFTLGTGYSERDVREAARALTGFIADWHDNGTVTIQYEADEHDDGVKTLLGRRGPFGVDDVLDLVVAHPKHAPFLVEKLWSFFVATPPSRETVRALVATYRANDLRIKPLVRAILEHPQLYRKLDAPDLVKCPVVYVAGALRTTGSHIVQGYPTWLLETMGQYPFYPPSVAGWDWGPAWMSSNSMRQRFTLGNYVVNYGRPRVRRGSAPATLTAQEAYELAWRAVAEPQVSPATRAALVHLAAHFFDDLDPDWRDKADWRGEALQATLRHLLLVCPDSQLH